MWLVNGKVVLLLVFLMLAVKLIVDVTDLFSYRHDVYLSVPNTLSILAMKRMKTTQYWENLSSKNERSMNKK